MNSGNSIKKENFFLKHFFLLSPILVLLITKIIIEICIKYFQPHLSWIPSFIGYYFTISLILFIASKYKNISIHNIFDLSFTPVPKIGWIAAGVIFPALIPLNVFILKINAVPLEFIIYILIFSIINPIFEEGFWRGLLSYIPHNKLFTILYSAFLFAFSHYLFWHFWFKIPMVTITTVISTFIMGIMWMWFYKKNRNIIYLIISHFFVDIFNLSVAVYSGAVSVW